MKLYYIEEKNYYLDDFGISHQMADGGEMPKLYHTLDKALAKAAKIVETEMTLVEYTSVTDIADEGVIAYNCRWGKTLSTPCNRIRLSIKVYEIDTKTD